MENKTQSNQQGFTLIELLVVIAILAVLATLYVPRIIASSSDAKNTVAIANARTLASEITMYNASHGDSVFKGTGAITGFSEGNQTKYAGCKIVTASDLTRAGGEGVAAAPADIKALANGREFPDSTVVVLVTDAKGNCFITKPNGDNITAE